MFGFLVLRNKLQYVLNVSEMQDAYAVYVCAGVGVTEWEHKNIQSYKSQYFVYLIPF